MMDLDHALLSAVLAYLDALAHYALCFSSPNIRARVLRARPILSLYIFPQTLSFPLDSIHSSEIVADSLLPGWRTSHPLPEVALDNLHVSLSSRPGGDCQKGRWKQEWVDLWRAGEGSGLGRFQEEAYGPIIESIVAALGFRERFGETEVYYSAVPLLRCCPPLPPMEEDARRGITRPKGYAARYGVLTCVPP
jgi:hypothetical protein